MMMLGLSFSRVSGLTRVVANKRIREMTSTNGHVVVRVEPGGAQYRIAVTDNSDESDTVLAVHGPYASRCPVAQTPGNGCPWSNG